MNRTHALDRARAFAADSLFTLLSDWVSLDTGSRADDRKPSLTAYLEEKIIPWLASRAFETRIVENPEDPCAPFLIARRVEDKALPTVLVYGHGDTVPGMDDAWTKGGGPFALTRDGDRWYGRGAADNKGQHAVNLAAMDCVLQERGTLGFNLTLLLEMGEEMGSPGLHAVCAAEKTALAADVLIASDGPRIEPGTPTIFGGSRAVFNFDLKLTLREGGHHSGNWGGLLANPGIILSHAISSLVDQKGKILVDALRPKDLPRSIAAAIDKLSVTGQGGPEIDPSWGEPGLSAARKVYGWNTLDVLAFECGTPASPVNAIPPAAWARCHIRFLADMDPATFIPAIRAHLDDHGFSEVEVIEVPNNYGLATRMAPDNPWVSFVTASFDTTLDLLAKGPEKKQVSFLPNLGGTLPNDAFSHVLGLPTIWVPHSYAGCCQHAPNEHVLPAILEEGLALMTGLFWDIGETGGPEPDKETSKKG
ncbi:M20 family metallopeptidase [Desulfospira joergensenii]|uniref:M20 family metallopeptidase n=1 Tax=Desulfospira joergensenii TaxID=53329 RepID=UPI0003B42491|nr:M20 family metallopeptidase [Desulfospira joergensenii]